MPRIAKNTVRKLVTLPLDIAERIVEFQKISGAPSESDALRILIEDGLKMRDTVDALFARLKAATERGQSIFELINHLAQGHPLIASTSIEPGQLVVYLKNSDPEYPDERLVFSHARRAWSQQRRSGHNYEDQWEVVPDPTKAASGARRGGGFPRGGSDLDDEIPF